LIIFNGNSFTFVSPGYERRMRAGPDQSTRLSQTLGNREMGELL
jgi:hypothetical protein